MSSERSYAGKVNTEKHMAEFAVRNRLLQMLPPDALARIRPDLERIRLASGEKVRRAFDPMTDALFPESGLLSFFAGNGSRDQTEIALLGREGMAGLCALLGPTSGPFDLVSQRPGEAHRMPLARLKAACEGCSCLRHVLMRYAYALTVQIAETGRANARQTVETRLARWLLMAHDRIDGDEIELTHETLSLILGVRRPGITVALHMLEGEHMIRARRGVVEILDRSKLRQATNGAYGLPEQEYERVLGTPRPAPAVRPAPVGEAGPAGRAVPA